MHSPLVPTSFFFKIRTMAYKDRGRPAQLGTRDWAGLKGHIDDRNLACSLASEGRSESPRGRLNGGPDRDCAQFLLEMCNFRPFGLNGSRCINLVRMCSGHWKFVALWHFELPHSSHISQIRSIVSRQFVLLHQHMPVWIHRAFAFRACICAHGIRSS
jgi:hypothetical protein